MVYWVREFKDRRSGDRFWVYGEAPDLPKLRAKIAEQRSEPDWLNQEIYVHDAGLDLQLPGNHELYVLPI
jgi:hypothetical protein